MKKLLALLLALVMVLSFAACNQPEEPDVPDNSESESETDNTEEPVFEAVHVERDDWADDVKAAVNDFMDMYGKASENYAEGESYVVFDFDNTCSIFDVEEQLAIYQLQTMTFAITPEQLPEVLATDIGLEDESLDVDTS